MKTIYILWLRQIKRYLRSRSRIIGSIGQPVLFLVAMGFGFGPIFQKAGAGNYLDFLSPGIIMMGILFTAVFSGIEIIWDRQFGFLKEILVAPVTRFEIMIGRTLGGATVACLQGVIVFIITLALGFRPNFLKLPIGFIFMILVALFFTALGISIASLFKDLQGFQLIMNFVIMPTFFLSGALFPVDDLPNSFKIVLSADPLAYGVDGLRGALTGLTYFGIGTDFLILSALVFIVLGIGSYLFSKIEL